jgi:hypothetical protein
MAELRLGRFEAEQGQLPMVCLRCGEPATVAPIRAFAWYPPWIIVLLLAGAVPFVIAAAILTKRVRMPVPTCARHKNQAIIFHVASIAGIVFLVLLGFGSMVALVNSPKGGVAERLTGFSCIGSVVALLVWWAVVAVWGSKLVRPSEITDHSITLAHVAESFVAAHQEQKFGAIPEVTPVEEPFGHGQARGGPGFFKPGQ